MTRFERVVMYLVLLMLSVQLMGTAFHKHDYTDTQSDCASCSFVHHLPSGLPPVALVVAPTETLLFYRIVAARTYVLLAQFSFLVPHSHAPPRRQFHA